MRPNRYFPIIFALVTACCSEGTPLTDPTTVSSTLHLVNHSDSTVPHKITAGPGIQSFGSFSLYGTGRSSVRQLDIALNKDLNMLDGSQLGQVDLLFNGASVAATSVVRGNVTLRPFGTLIENGTSPIFNIESRIYDGTFKGVQFMLTNVLAIDELTGHQVVLTTADGSPQTWPVPLTLFNLQEGNVVSSLIARDSNSFRNIVASDYVQQLLGTFRLAVYGEYVELTETTVDLTLTGFTADSVKDLTVEDYDGHILGMIAVVTGGTNPQAVFKPKYLMPSWANDGKLNTILYVSAKILSGAKGSVQATLRATALGKDSNLNLPVADVSGDIIPVTSH